MSVIGIDFGNDCCYIAVARAGGIETIANDYSQRQTPSCVSFGEKQRLMGVAAKNQQVTNMKNTLTDFKRLVGRKFHDPIVQRDRGFLPYDIKETPNGNIAIKVHYLGEEHTFSPEQVTAMLFTKLKEISETALKIKVYDCVISVPAYFADCERRAILDSAQIAGLNVLKLMNEPTAAALTYGIYKQDLPGLEEQPRNVVFVDMGQSALQVSAVAFNKAKLKMLACVMEPDVGGRDFDRVLADNLTEDFKQRFKVDASKKPRAYLRLEQEAEKLKKQMSANSTVLPLNIECFIDEKDVNARMKRSDMETLCSDIFARIQAVFKRLLADSGLRPDDIHSVELIGGGTRVPLLKKLVAQVFGKEPSTTLNQDEAVARGCALQCAMLSPNFKVREFSVTDLQPYPIKLMWNADKGEDGEMEVFSKNHVVPFSKLLTFYRKDPFILEARYSELPYDNYPNHTLGQFYVTKVTPTPQGESSKVKVKVRVNLHGVFLVSSAHLTEKKDSGPEEEPQPMEVENGPADNTPNGEAADQPDSNPSSQENGTENVTTGKAKKAPSAKKVSKQIDLPIEATVPALSRKDLEHQHERELNMIASDRQERERIDAKNAVEEYVYEMRDKLSTELIAYVSDKDKDILTSMLEDTENWLYNEGEEQARNVYKDKYELLRKHGDPIKDRQREYEDRPRALESLHTTIQQAEKIVHLFENRDERYDHLDADDVEKKVIPMLQEKRQFYERQMGLNNRLEKHHMPAVTCAQIKQEKKDLEHGVTPILLKQKPKPKQQEEPPKQPGPDVSGDTNANDSNTTPPPADGKTDSQNNNSRPEMEVD